MALPVFQRSVVTDTGNIIPNAQVTVTDTATGGIVTLFADADGNTGLANPFNATSEGFARFYATPGVYNVTATGSQGTIQWVDVHLIDSADIITIGQNFAAVETVADNIDDVNTAADNIQVIIDAPQAATDAANSASASANSATASANSATASANSATQSANSATAAANSASAASTSESNASNSATASANSATASANSASAAATSESNASSSATASANSATASANSATSAANSLEEFQEIYHGARSTAPTANVDVGDLYFDTVKNEMLVYNNDGFWVQAVRPFDTVEINQSGELVFTY